MNKQFEALRLADELYGLPADDFFEALGGAAAAELRRLHALNAELLAALKVLMRDFEAVYGDGDLEMQPALYQACDATIKATGEQQ